MLLTSHIALHSLVVHKVGSKANDEGFTLSKSTLRIDNEPVKELLINYFLHPFKNTEYFQFHHHADIALNEMFSFSTRVFADPDSFYLQSVNITAHLYDQSAHPKIKGGEFYLAHFTNCIVDGEEVDAIGVFKSETKETYLKVSPMGDSYEINAEDGININKLDKGCLIFNTEKEKGYKVCMVDRQGDAQYWRDDFLKIQPRQDSYHYTHNYLDMCKTFVTDKLAEEFDVSKTDQIDMLNRSVDFFKKKEQFDFNEFSTEVIRQPDLIDSFKDFREQFQQERELPIVDEFDISTQAVKKQAKIFKSVLKLDKNFHIYIHGNKDMIESGVDEATGLKYYKIYYKEES